MTKAELVSMVSEKANSSKSTVETILESFVIVLTKEVKKGNKVSFPGLGTFEKTKRKARMGRNPATNEPMKIAAKNAPKFKASKTFKDFIA